MAQEYCLVSAQGAEPFEARCSAKAAMGWTAQGGVSTVFNTGGYYVVYSQAFVRDRKRSADTAKPKASLKKVPK